MDTMQIVLLSLAGLIIVFVMINSALRYFKNRQIISSEAYALEEYGEEEILPIVQDDEFENVEIIEADSANTIKEQKASTATNHHNDFMMISVHAKPNCVFSDYGFVQTMGSVGLEYGEHKIFHYDVKTDIGMQRLFSVAQLNKPGIFDIDHVETINCRGLLLFIDLRSCRKQTLALDCMLETAYQLAEDLDGVMFEGYNIPWQEDTPRALAQKLESYQKNIAGLLDEITY